MSKTDGIIITGAISEWKYFNFPLTFHLLAYLYIHAQEQEDATVTVSVRQLARQFKTTYKEMRVALNHLIGERIISVSRKAGLSVITFSQWNSLNGIIIPYRAHKGAHKVAQVENSQPTENEVLRMMCEDTEGAHEGAHEGACKNGAHKGAHKVAQVENSQPTENEVLRMMCEDTEGAHEGAHEGARNRKGSQKKEKVSPTPPIKSKESTPPKDQKNKKIRFSDDFFEKVRVAFNALAIGTAIRSCTKMSDERKQLVRNFVDDYSVEDIDRLFSAVREAPRLYKGRSGKSIQFDTLFSPKFYVGIMEGSWSAPEPQPNVVSSLPEPPAQTETADSSLPQPTYKERKKNERRELLRGYIEDFKKNPKSSCGKLLMAVYNNGELKELGLDWKPSVDSDIQQLEELNKQWQKIHSSSNKKSASAAEVIADDPNGLLARIIKQQNS